MCYVWLTYARVEEMIRDSFVEAFSKEEAANVEAAAEEHLDDMFSNRGSDYFRWAICICIGFECMSKDSYRKYHGIVTPWETLKEWIKEHGDLQHHDGDVDTLAYGTGVYEEFGLIKEISDEELGEAYTSTVLDMLSAIADGDGPKRYLR